jgi:hypothetical protein
MKHKAFILKYDELISLPDIELIYGDQMHIETLIKNKWGANKTLSALTFKMKIATDGTNGLLTEVSGTKSGSLVNFEIDTTLLPSAGAYKYQIQAEDGGDNYIATGKLLIGENIQ